MMPAAQDLTRHPVTASATGADLAAALQRTRPHAEVEVLPPEDSSGDEPPMNPSSSAEIIAAIESGDVMVISTADYAALYYAAIVAAESTLHLANGLCVIAADGVPSDGAAPAIALAPDLVEALERGRAIFQPADDEAADAGGSEP